jgi:ABC-type transporter Mla MlaB component
MSSPNITAHTDTGRQILTVHVAGPLVETAQTDLLRDACAAAPAGYGLLINLSAVSRLSEGGLAALREMVLDAAAEGHQVAFVCAELMLRAELVLADLDTLVPVVEADEQALPLVSFAA